MCARAGTPGRYPTPFLPSYEGSHWARVPGRGPSSAERNRKTVAHWKGARRFGISHRSSLAAPLGLGAFGLALTPPLPRS